jgi:inorganic pyrophosphatase
LFYCFQEIIHFFQTYKNLKNPDNPPTVEINGVKGKEEAIEAVKKSIELYKEKFGK